MKYGKPDDVIVTVDGDDWLAHEDVLTIINARYERDGCWVMYGGTIWKPEDRRNYESARYSAEEIANLRIPLAEDWRSVQYNWKVNSLRTFRCALYQQIGALDSDWSCLKDGDGFFYKMAGDVAIMLPLIECAGEQRIQHNRSPVYVYNLHEHNDHELDRPGSCASPWRSLPSRAFHGWNRWTQSPRGSHSRRRLCVPRERRWDQAFTRAVGLSRVGCWNKCALLPRWY